MILVVVGFLVLCGVGRAFAAEVPAAPPLPKVTKEDGRQYNHFLFVRHKRIVHAKVTPDGFELKDLGTWPGEPLCVVGGKLYAIKSPGPGTNNLLSIDMATGQAKNLCSTMGLHTYDSARLYAVINRRDGGNTLRVFDFGKGAYRDVRSIPLGRPIHPIAVSPDHKRVAYWCGTRFDGSKTPPASPQLTVLELDTGKVLQPGDPVLYLIPTIVSWVKGGQPFVWVDSRTVLCLRTHLPKEPVSSTWSALKMDGTVNKLATIDIITGERKDVVTLPGSVAFTMIRLVQDGSGAVPRVILRAPRLGLARYRIDLKGGKLVEDDTIGGEYRLCEVERAQALYHGDRLLEKTKVLSEATVSPDGKRIIWIAAYPRRELFYYDRAEDVVRTLAQGGLGDSLLWFAEQDLKAPSEAVETPVGWIPFADLPRLKPRPPRLKPRPPQPHTRKNVPEYLTFTMSTDKDTYRLHQPVRVTLTVTNISDSDIEILPPVLFDYRAVTVDLDYPGGSKRMYWNNVTMGAYFPKKEKILLKAGDSVTVTDALEVVQPGGYQINVLFTGVVNPLGREWRGAVRAEPVKFSVEASPDAEQLFKAKFERLLAKSRAEFNARPNWDGFNETLQKDMVAMGPEVVPYIIEVAKGEKDVRFRKMLYQPLVRIASPEALPFYRESLMSGDAALRNMACLGLFEVHRRGTSAADKALQVLLDALGSGDVNVRPTAAKLLVRVYDDRVKAGFEAAVEDDDETVSTTAARYLAAYEGLALAEWLARARESPTHARYLAAKSIIKELEDDWHMEKGELPPAPWSDVSKSPEMLAQFRQTLLAWLEWASENPRASSRFFFNRDRWWWSKPAAN